MNKRFLAFVLLLLLMPGDLRALYQGDYALVVDGPTSVDLNSTEQFTATAYDPAGAEIKNVTFSRTFTTPGLITVKRQMTITKPDGTKTVLNGSLDVMVKTPGSDDGGAGGSDIDGVLFTDPSLPSSNVKNATVELIDSAKTEVLMAAYTVESAEVREALIAAAKRLGRGKVKLIVEEKSLQNPDLKSVYDSLRAAGVTIVSDGTASGSLMHNKFVVVDGKSVLSGSTNFTGQQLTNDANNTVIFHDRDLAAAYATEFQEMMSGSFDGSKTDNTQHEFVVQVGGGAGKVNVNTASAAELASLPDIGPSIAQKIVSYREANGPFDDLQDLDAVSGIGSATITKISPYATVSGDGSTRSVPIEVYFSPSDEVKNQLLDVINGAKTSLSFSIFTFTDPDIADALRAAKNRGVVVQGVFDAWQAKSSYSQYDDLKNAGLDVKKDGYTTLNHSKYLIADGSTVVTGSYNWTGSASTDNDENIMIVRDSLIATQFSSNFNATYAAGN